MRLIFDSHLDLSWNALSFNRDQTESVEQINQREAGMTAGGGRGHATTSLPEMRKAGVGVCLGTLLVRAKRHVQPAVGHRRTDLDYGTQSIAYAVAQGQLAYYRLLVEQGQMQMIGTVGELDAHWQRWCREPHDRLPIGNILAMEGADPIVDPSQVEAWFGQGLRSVMLSHYGQSHYSVGTSENGPLTPRGVEMLKQFERVGMILDMTHLSDQSFFEAIDRFSGPVMASHNNCRALVPGDRQFSDQQILPLVERDAVIGVVCDAWMLQPGWAIGSSNSEQLTMAALVDQIDHICQLAGNARHVGIGSDLDGGYGTEQTPGDLRTIADLQRLEPLLSKRGYSDDDINGIFHGNWLAFFRRSLPR
ncbi:MAG TPA: membrane dipeptidase [Pirellulales bacterium]|jgi:membrane dipeptidase|nr:membrane dipeptidase [Pirellulales bacterium]